MKIRRLILTWVYGLAAMAPWPVVGVLLVRSQFDSWLEGAFMFGSVTVMVVGLPLALAIGDIPQIVMAGICVGVWALAWIVPPVCVGRRLGERRVLLGLLGAQGGFAVVQAVLGMLFVIGKSV